MTSDARRPTLDTSDAAVSEVTRIFAELLDTGQIVPLEVREILALIYALLAERDALRATIVRTEEALIRLQPREDPPDGTATPGR